MPFPLFTQVALKNDVPAHKLLSGDVAIVVEIHSGMGGLETGYSLEVFDALGDTLAVVTVGESDIESLDHNEVLHVRRLDGTTAR